MLYATPYRVRTNYNYSLAFNGPEGPPAFVPLTWQKVEIKAAGDIFWVSGACLVSSRPGEEPEPGYAGFIPEYFSATELIITSHDLTNVEALDLNTVTALDLQDGGDAWYSQEGLPGGGTTNPYCKHTKGALYVASANEIGDRWIALVAWATSFNATFYDYVIAVPSETYLDILQLSQVP